MRDVDVVMVRAHYVYASIALISSPCVACPLSRTFLFCLFGVACDLFFACSALASHGRLYWFALHALLGWSCVCLFVFFLRCLLACICLRGAACRWQPEHTRTCVCTRACTHAYICTRVVERTHALTCARERTCVVCVGLQPCLLIAGIAVECNCKT